MVPVDKYNAKSCHQYTLVKIKNETTPPIRKFAFDRE